MEVKQFEKVENPKHCVGFMEIAEAILKAGGVERSGDRHKYFVAEKLKYIWGHKIQTQDRILFSGLKGYYRLKFNEIQTIILVSKLMALKLESKSQLYMKIIGLRFDNETLTKALYILFRNETYDSFIKEQ